MDSLIQNFGLNWGLLLSQAVNFLLVFIILRMTVYKPLLEVMKKRKQKIENGIAKEEEASHRLLEISELEKEKFKEVERKALGILQSAEERGKKEEAKILDAAAKKNEAAMKTAAAQIDAEKRSAILEAEHEVETLVKKVLLEVVSVNPKAIDEALIKKVAEKMAHESA